MTESGFAGIDVVNYFDLMAPAGTPVDIVTSLNAVINRVVALPDVLARFKLGTVEAALGLAAQRGRFIEADYRDWRSVVRAQNLKIE